MLEFKIIFFQPQPTTITMREIVHLQAGQCGNQIGAKFWEIISDEHGNNEQTIQFFSYDFHIQFFSC